MGKPTRGIYEAVRRVRGEYLEMPGLRLTSEQARRLWRLAPFYWLLLLAGYTAMATPFVAEWLAGQANGGYGRSCTSLTS